MRTFGPVSIGARRATRLAAFVAAAVSAGALFLTGAGSNANSEARPHFAPPLDPGELTKPPRPFLHSSNDRPVVGQQSSWCWVVPERHVGACADFVYEPPPGRRVHVGRGGELLLDMRVPTESLTVVARKRASGAAPTVRLTARRERGSSRIWRVRIPAEKARRLRVIEVFARYPQGDGLFLAPLREKR